MNSPHLATLLNISPLSLKNNTPVTLCGKMDTRNQEQVDFFFFKILSILS